MNINNAILDKIEDFLYNYGSFKFEFQRFIEFPVGSDERRNISIEMIEEIMTSHKKQALYSYISELGRIEAGIRDLEPWVRDHVSHAIHCFALGIFINEYYLVDNYNIRINHFQWKLTSLFHDIGYPVEIAQNLIKPYNNKIDEIRLKLGIKKKEKSIFRITYDDLIHLNHDESLKLIQEQIDRWDLKVDIKSEYFNRKSDGIVCHGIISGLLLLKLIDLMYESYNPKREYIDIYVKADDEKTNWNQKYFDNDVVPACASIFIHNLPISSFNGTKINPKKAPLAFLLKLTDTLQDWERSSKDFPKGFPADQYALKYDQGSITIKIGLDLNRTTKINNELNDFFDIDNIRIE